NAGTSIRLMTSPSRCQTSIWPKTTYAAIGWARCKSNERVVVTFLQRLGWNYCRFRNSSCLSLSTSRTKANLSTGPSLRLTSRCLTASQRHDYCYRCEKKPRRSGAESDAVRLGYSEPRTPTYRASGPWRSRPASPSGSVPNDSSDSGNDGPVDVGWLLRRGWIF